MRLTEREQLIRERSFHQAEPQLIAGSQRNSRELPQALVRHNEENALDETARTQGV